MRTRRWRREDEHPEVPRREKRAAACIPYKMEDQRGYYHLIFLVGWVSFQGRVFLPWSIVDEKGRYVACHIRGSRVRVCRLFRREFQFDDGKSEQIGTGSHGDRDPPGDGDERFIAVKQGTRISFTVCDGLFERREGEADTRLPPVFSFSFLSAALVDGPKAEGRN